MDRSRQAVLPSVARPRLSVARASPLVAQGQQGAARSDTVPDSTPLPESY